MSVGNHRAGFVNIIGRPNVGKSTLMNVLVGEKLSIITSKAQTTRHRIMGVLNGENFQIVYSDTPGVIKPAYELQKSMMSVINTSLQDADIILFMVDVKEKIPALSKSQALQEIIRKLISSNKIIFLVINKIDLVEKERVASIISEWSEVIPAKEIIPVSALNQINIDTLFDNILQYLPQHPAYFPEDELTDKSQRFFAAEIIREKVLLNYQKEIPYSTEIVIESFKEEEKIIRIRAEIYVERRSQRGIIIGKGGEAIKKVGIEARKDLEAFFEKQVYLEQYVKVETEWRKKAKKLSKFGY